MKYYRMDWKAHVFNGLIYRQENQNRPWFFYSPKEKRWIFCMGIDLDECNHLTQLTKEEAFLEMI